MGRNFKTYRCGGYSSYSGHCGAGDCETCHPGGARQMAIDEATEGLRAKLDDLENKLAEIENKMCDLVEDSEEWLVLNDEHENLQREIDEVSSEIASVENGFDGDDEPDYDYEPDYNDRYDEVDWESPY